MMSGSGSGSDSDNSTTANSSTDFNSTTANSSTDFNLEDCFWLVSLPSLGGIVLISIVFLVIVLVCKRIHRKADMKYVHQQQKRRNESNGSVYFVQGHGIELQSSRTRSSEFVNVLEGVQNVGESDLANTTDGVNINNTYDVIADGEIRPAQNEHDICTGQVMQEVVKGRNKDRDFSSSVFISETVPHENQSFSRRSDTRSSVRSDSRILDHMRLEPEPDNARSQFSRHMSTRMSTRSEAGNTSKNTRLVTFQQSQPNTKTFQKVAEDSYPEGSMERMQKFSIHQVQSPTLQEDSRIPVGGLSLKINSPFGDIPSFKDPELTGDDDDLKNSLMFPLPPDIYSSQIFNSEELVEETEESLVHNTEHMGGVASQSIPLRRSMDKIVSIEPPVSDYSDDDEPINPDPRYSCIIIKSRPQSVEDPENLYDEPILISTPNNEKLLLAAPIFDDPGYDRGFKSMGATAETLEENKPHQYHTLEPQFVLNEATQMERRNQQENLSGDRDQNGDLNNSLAASKMNSKSTLALLDFREEELQDMDPDLLSHLQGEDKNYAL